MDMGSILNYEADPNEDYYGLLGCDSSASTEQIIAEYKARAKNCHPDRNSAEAQSHSREKFQHLLQAKEVLTDPQERSLYDAWRSAGMAMRYSAWRNLKASVRSSMHWATPKTSGRMLDMVGEGEANEPISLNPSPVTDKDRLVDQVSLATASVDEDVYNPTPYEEIGFRIDTPPPSFWNDDHNGRLNQHASNEQPPNPSPDPATVMKRRQFAVRRQSTIGAMIWADKYDDNEIRRRFRNYEI